MTSGRLWVLVGLLASPLAIAAVTGCDRVFGLQEVPTPFNAYTCQCACNAGTRTKTITVSARTDDAEQRTSDNSMLLGNNSLRMSASFIVGTRFAQLGIPQGAAIKSASVQFTAAASDASNPVAIAISIESNDDAPTFTTANASITGRTYEPTPVSWSPGAWTQGVRGSDQLTPDLTALVQAEVSRPLWTDQSSLVLKFETSAGSRAAASFENNPVNAATLTVSYVDAASQFTTNLPVCTEGFTADASAIPDAINDDCTGRVENTFKDLVGACGYVQDPANNCNCQVVATGFHDQNENGTDDPGEDYFGFTREICDATCTEVPVNLPADPNDPTRCNNFDPKDFASCIISDLATCQQNGTNPSVCDTTNCDTFVSATNVANDTPVCVAHASSSPRPIAFQLFGRRSTCEVTGRSTIQVGDDHREPEKNPLTGGTVDILGGPCPGDTCVVGISTQLAMNNITFSVKFASDPTFTDLVQGGNSVLTAATLDTFGNGEIPKEAAIAVARGRRDDNVRAYFGSNEAPLDIGIDWANFVCELDGNLVSSVDAEDPQGLCKGDNATVCRHDSDCADAGVDGPCQLPSSDAEPFTVNVSLDGPLVNQPPTANAGRDQTVECTSPAGASFLLDGTASADPDGAGDLRIFSWRSQSRTGQEIGFDPTIAASLGVGVSSDFVLRVIDSFGQADEDTTNVHVEDTTPPTLSCNAPATMTPPQTAISFTATATDVCTAGVITPQLTDFQCFKINSAGKPIDTTKSCKVTINGAKITIGSTIGVGDHIVWNGRASDATGNVGLVRCAVEVVSQGKTK